MTGFIIPSNDKTLLAILNSSLVKFLMEIWAISRRGGYLEYKTQYISKIPIKTFSGNFKNEILTFVNKIMDLSQKRVSKINRFQKRIKSNLNLEKLSKKLQTFYNYDFKTFIKELKKKKVVLSLVDQDEWQDYFEAYQTEINQYSPKLTMNNQDQPNLVNLMRWLYTSFDRIFC